MSLAPRASTTLTAPPTRPGWTRGPLLLGLALVLLMMSAPGAAHAQALGLELAPVEAEGSAGDTVVFSGRITNTTGSPLLASEMFLNFLGYDPDAFVFIQMLGEPDFSLPNNTFSAFVPLFRLFIAPTAPVGTYSFGVFLQDVNDVTSGTVTASINVVALSTVPEPASFLLIATGYAGLMLRRRRRRQE